MCQLSISFRKAHIDSLFPALDYLPDFLSPWRVEAKKAFLDESAVRLLVLIYSPLANRHAVLHGLHERDEGEVQERPGH